MTCRYLVVWHLHLLAISARVLCSKATSGFSLFPLKSQAEPCLASVRWLHHHIANGVSFWCSGHVIMLRGVAGLVDPFTYSRRSHDAQRLCASFLQGCVLRRRGGAGGASCPPGCLCTPGRVPRMGGLLTSLCTYALSCVSVAVEGMLLWFERDFGVVVVLFYCHSREGELLILSGELIFNVCVHSLFLFHNRRWNHQCFRWYVSGNSCVFCRAIHR